MSLFTLLQRVYQRINQRASERLAYQQLRKLDPYLLQDIGLRLEEGRVLPINPDTSAANKCEAAAQVVKREHLQHRSSVLDTEPEGTGG